MKIILLSNGTKMPIIAIGTNWMDYKELKSVMKAGFDVGFRAIDTARDYGNEPVVGAVLRDLLKETGLKRSDVFVTTKIGNDQQRDMNIKEQLEMSLINLQTGYIDLWLMHWPYPGYFHQTWAQMIELYNTGKVKAIGVANYQVRHFEDLRNNYKLITGKDDFIMPMVNQMEYHPLRTAIDIVEYMKNNNIRIQAYAPLCRMVSPLKEAPILNELAKKYGKSLGQIILRWHVQQGFVMPVFKTYKLSRFAENIDIFDFEMTTDEMNQLSALNIDYKYHIESPNCPGY